MEYLEAYWKELLNLTYEMAPYLLLGFLIAGLLNGVFRKNQIQKHLGPPTFLASLKASIFGIPLPLCSCGVIPTGMSFYDKGASKGSTVSFLISTPQTGVDSVLATYALLGWPFAIMRPIIALITGVFGGAITNIFGDKTETKSMSINKHVDSQHWFDRIFKYAFVEFLQDISRWLILGLLLAALIAVAIPDDFFTNYIGNPYLTMLIMLAISVPFYVCATGSIPIAAAFMMKGVDPGSALVFLMAGPATNIATITVLGKVLGKRTLFAYLGSIIGGALVFGLLINLIFPAGYFTYFLNHSSGEHGHALPMWLMISSSIVLILLIINAEVMKLFNLGGNTHSHDHKGESDETIIVEGMTCNHCKANVENGLTELEGIDSVTADIVSKKVNISGHASLESIQKKVESLGYVFKGKAE